jgi:hypothetical protein
LGHAHHFLSRLDRVSLPQVEIALDLYNDVPLLRFILESARIPEGAPRVAISLDHPENGPFLIVTRDGHFVTCLGEGMSPGEHPVITRGQLDGIAAKAGVLRARLAAAERMAGPMGGVGKLLRRIHEAANELSREEIVAIAGLQPLYAFEFFQCLFAASHDVMEARKILLVQLRRSDKLRPQFRDALRSYWNTLWSIGHFAVLCSLDGWASVERWPEQARALVPTAPLSWVAVREGIAPIALRGLWAAGRIGKPLLAGYKQRYREADSPLSITDGGAGLAVIGLRHARLYAEVVKVLTSGPDLGDDDPLAGLVRSMNDALLGVVKPENGAPADYTGMQRVMGATRWVEAAKHLPPGSPLRFESVDAMPEDLALCIAANDAFDFLGQSSSALLVYTMLPWVARAAPEQLYLPREVLKLCWAPWDPEPALVHLRLHRDYFLHQRPRRRPEGPARKGPCPCGSGKKYKRCCGADEGGGAGDA